MKPDIILVDGSSYLYRAFHAMPSFTNSQGEPTGAIYGVINMMRRLIQDYPDAAIAIIFDAKGKTFRDDLFPDYKANRPPMPDELAAQIMPLHQALSALGLPLIVESGVEADDVIGTLAQAAENQNKSVLISSSDKDLAQLVTNHIILSNTMNDTLLDPEGVREKFGVPPERIVDFLALVGDTVDNIPGVPKVGPKTAAKWINQYGGVEEIVARADEISGKVGENLRASVETIPLSYRLATIKCDVPLTINLADLNRSAPDIDALVKLFKRFEFKSWLSEVLNSSIGIAADSSVKIQSTASSKQYQLIEAEDKLQELISLIDKADIFAFDTETTSLDYIVAQLVGMSFAVEGSAPFYLPVAHDYPEAPDQLDRDHVLKRLKPILEDANKKKLGQNLKYDMSVLANYNITLRGISHDTMLQSYVLDSVATRHDLDSLALKYLGHKTIHFEDIAGKGAKQLTFNLVPIEQAAPYAAEDAEVCLHLNKTLGPKLAELEGLKRVYEEIEIPLVPVLSRMERNGVLIDSNMLAAQSQAFADEIFTLEHKAHELAGGVFNLASPKQIQKVLFEDLDLPIIKKTPKGQPSTAEEVLVELAMDYELPAVILKHRSLSKLKSTYTDKLPQQVSPVTGRVHTSYHQAVTATGRLSSSDPNLQNIPVRNEEGRRIRRAFIAPPGYCMVAADYSQIELRILAHISGDEGLLKAFREGTDIHRATASEIFAISPEEVQSDQRRAAKAINFGLVYGMSAFGLSRQLEVDRQTAQQYMDHYFDKYPGVKQYMADIRANARDTGFVETLFGRRLYLPDIRSSNGMRRQYAERTAINAPMQGTAADIIKRAMITCDRHFYGEKGEFQASEVRMIMQVHDELVFEVAESALEGAKADIKRLMESAAAMAVPLEVDIGVGFNWDEAH